MIIKVNVHLIRLNRFLKKCYMTGVKFVYVFNLLFQTINKQSSGLLIEFFQFLNDSILYNPDYLL